MPDDGNLIVCPGPRPWWYRLFLWVQSVWNLFWHVG